MKKLLFIILSTSILLCACSKEPQPASQVNIATSEAPASASSEPQSVVSTAPSESASSEESSSSSVKKGSLEISVPIQSDTGSQGTLTMHVPETWNFDGYNVLSRDGVKTMEIVRAAAVTDASNPISDNITYGFGATDEMEYPDGLGLIDTFEGVAGGNDYRMYVYKIITDTGEMWYPHYTFIHIGDYILQVHFYPFEQTDEMATYIDIMKTMALTF